MARPNAAASGWPTPSRAAKRTILLLIAVWLALQILIPLRYLLYPGNPSWTEEGHRFAWMMKLRDKKAEATFTVHSPAKGQVWQVDTLACLTERQARKMRTRPELILQFAHHLADHWARERGVPDVEVRARVCVSLNGRKAALLIDPAVDLAKVEYGLGPERWIMPLNEPFERPPDRSRRRDLRC